MANYKANTQANECAIFSDAFLKIDSRLVVQELADKGYFAFPSAITEEALKAIEDDATKIRLSLNRNAVGGVYAEMQYYCTSMLAVSKSFFEYCTHPIIFDICKQYLGGKFRLKALRYYETYGGHHMQWHTDNKTDKEFAHIPGLIFIVYVSDVEDGEVQVVEGSHNWSGEMAYSDFSDDFIENKYGSLIKSIKMPHGSILIFNTYVIHRAKPVTNKNFVRKSLFFQVDTEINKSEPIIVNTEYLSNVSEVLAGYLGFGREAGYEVYPNTNLNSLRMSKPLMLILSKWVTYRLVRSILGIFPQALKKNIYRLTGKQKDSRY